MSASPGRTEVGGGGFQKVCQVNGDIKLSERLSFGFFSMTVGVMGILVAIIVTG